MNATIEITDAMVEAGAAAHQKTHGLIAWSTASDELKNWRRRQIRVILEAALAKAVQK